MDIFDIYIAYILWGSGGKKRPVLILEQQSTVIHVFNITTQYESKSDTVRSKYFKINEWRQAGLDKQSYVDTSIIRDLPPAALERKTPIGKLTENDQQRFLEFLEVTNDQ